jgi:hypothetical protein
VSKFTIANQNQISRNQTSRYNPEWKYIKMRCTRLISVCECISEFSVIFQARCMHHTVATPLNKHHLATLRLHNMYAVVKNQCSYSGGAEAAASALWLTVQIIIEREEQRAAALRPRDAAAAAAAIHNK